MFAEREHIYMLDAGGNVLSGFPVEWEDEMRSLAAGDVNGDGQLEIVVAAFTRNEDVLNAFDAGGSQLPGFPPVASGTSGCEVDDRCYLAGGTASGTKSGSPAIRKSAMMRWPSGDVTHPISSIASR